MNFVRIAAFAVGGVAIAVGLLWLGQGTGLVRWPAESFMIADRTWARNGLLLAAAGCIIVWLGSRKH